jgi:hypothetical protein
MNARCYNRAMKRFVCAVLSSTVILASAVAWASDKGMGSDADEAVAAWMKTPRGEPADWLRTLADAVVRAQRTLGPRVRLVVVTSEPATALFRYRPLWTGEVALAAAKAGVPLYVEVEGYQARRGDDGVRVELSAFAIVSSLEDNRAPVKVPLGTHAFTAQDDRGITPLVLSLEIPNVAPGSYEAIVDVTDKLGGKSAKRNVKITVR